MAWSRTISSFRLLFSFRDEYFAFSFPSKLPWAVVQKETYPIFPSRVMLILLCVLLTTQRALIVPYHQSPAGGARGTSAIGIADG